MKLFDRIKRELSEEFSYISTTTHNWWASMTEMDKLYSLCMICAACLLLGLRGKPQTHKKTVNYEQRSQTSRLAQQFVIACAILVLFTLGINMTVDSMS